MYFTALLAEFGVMSTGLSEQVLLWYQLLGSGFQQQGTVVEEGRGDL